MPPYIPFRCLILLLGLSVIICTGCGPKRPSFKHPSVSAAASIKGSSTMFQAGQILDLQAGQAIDFQELISRLRARDLVFVGEIHDNAGHHLIQVQILQQLLKDRPKTAVGIEFLPHTVQPVVDDFMRGTLSERQFLDQSDWSKNWGFDFHLYRALFHEIKENAASLLALNAPHAVAKKVARSGLSELEPEERLLLADSIRLDNTDYRDSLQEIFTGHAHSSLTDFDFFYQAQCARDETMAQQIVAHWRKQTRQIIVFCGNGHLVRNFGIPDRVQRRQALEAVTLLLKPISDSLSLDPREGDFVWLTKGR